MTEDGRIATADATSPSPASSAFRFPRWHRRPRVVVGTATFFDAFDALSLAFVPWTLWWCAYFITNGLNNWMPTLYNRVYALDLQQSLRAGTLTNVMQVIVLLGCAFVIDRTGRRLWTAPSPFAAGTLMLGMLGLFGAHSVVAVRAVAKVTLSYGIAGSFYAVLCLYTPEIYPTRMRAIHVGGFVSRPRSPRCWSDPWLWREGIRSVFPDVRRCGRDRRTRQPRSCSRRATGRWRRSPHDGAQHQRVLVSDGNGVVQSYWRPARCGLIPVSTRSMELEMKKLIGVAAVLVLSNPLAASAQTPTADEQISQAVQVLPEDLRAGDTVVT